MSESDWRETLRERGYRLTPQRELILGAVEQLGHATPDEVLAEVRTHSDAVNASTVYRTLEVLEELGLVRHAHLSDRAPTYHSVTEHEHFHLVCRNCHKVISVDPDVLTPVIDRLAADHAFTVDIGHLTVFGHCEDCSSMTSPAARPARRGRRERHRRPGRGPLRLAVRRAGHAGGRRRASSTCPTTTWSASRGPTGCSGCTT